MLSLMSLRPGIYKLNKFKPFISNKIYNHTRFYTILDLLFCDVLFSDMCATLKLISKWQPYQYSNKKLRKTRSQNKNVIRLSTFYINLCFK